MDNNMTQADKALIHAYSDHIGEEPEFTQEYLEKAKKALFMEYSDPKNDEPTELEWAHQFVEEGHYQQVLDEMDGVLDYGEVMDYIETNYSTYGPFMFIND